MLNIELAGGIEHFGLENVEVAKSLNVLSKSHFIGRRYHSWDLNFFEVHLIVILTVLILVLIGILSLLDDLSTPLPHQLVLHTVYGELLRLNASLAHKSAFWVRSVEVVAGEPGSASLRCVIWPICEGSLLHCSNLHVGFQGFFPFNYNRALVPLAPLLSLSLHEPE